MLRSAAPVRGSTGAPYAAGAQSEVQRCGDRYLGEKSSSRLSRVYKNKASVMNRGFLRVTAVIQMITIVYAIVTYVSWSGGYGCDILRTYQTGNCSGAGQIRGKMKLKNFLTEVVSL